MKYTHYPTGINARMYPIKNMSKAYLKSTILRIEKTGLDLQYLDDLNAELNRKIIQGLRIIHVCQVELYKIKKAKNNGKKQTEKRAKSKSTFSKFRIIPNTNRNSNID
jgi:hypothetical protein